MAVFDQPSVELVEQLGFLRPRRITDRLVLRLGPQNAVCLEV